MRGRAVGLARLAVAIVVAAWAGSATAQLGWSVQTVALRDLRDATAQVGNLRSLALPAYVEFAMREGVQFVRVRVGCFTERETAEAWASVLRGRVTVDAVAVPIERALPPDVPCVATEVGFRKPAAWALTSEAGDLPTFRVEVGGHVAFVRHDGDAWRLWQGVAPDPWPAPQVAAEVIARDGDVAGVPMARSTETGALCPGQLVGTAGAVAIVDRGDAIVACWTVDLLEDS